MQISIWNFSFGGEVFRRSCIPTSGLELVHRSYILYNAYNIVSYKHKNILEGKFVFPYVYFNEVIKWSCSELFGV